MERFAYRKLCDGQLDENYAILYQEFLFDPLSREEGERLAPKLFTHRLYCDDDKVRQIVVRHEQLQEEESVSVQSGRGIYPDIYRMMRQFFFRMTNSVVMQQRYHII